MQFLTRYLYTSVCKWPVIPPVLFKWGKENQAIMFYHPAWSMFEAFHWTRSLLFSS